MWVGKLMALGTTLDYFELEEKKTEREDKCTMFANWCSSGVTCLQPMQPSSVAKHSGGEGLLQFGPAPQQLPLAAEILWERVPASALHSKILQTRCGSLVLGTAETCMLFCL